MNYQSKHLPQTTAIVLLWIIMITLFLISPNLVKAEQYYFQDEFNENRSVNTLNSLLWDTYNTRSSFANILELNGTVTLNQSPNDRVFPFVVSKQQAFPNGDFIAEVKFQYTKVTPWGVGIGFSDVKPSTTNTFTSLINIGIWQDTSVGPNMRITYGGGDIYTIPINTDIHTLTVTHLSNKYLIQLDNQIIFTSPETTLQTKYIWFGNFGLQNTGVPEWTKLSIDHIRVKETTTVSAPTPFLRLPWDYEAEGLTFNEAATRMSSYLDHEYPFLSTNIAEPNDLVSYENIRGAGLSYSAHDGYDYARRSKAFIDKPVLASANGTATFLGNCRPCGKAILINHNNGYQTRYYHLQDSELITPLDGTPVEVSKGQKIGLIGYSGHVIPSGPNGAHLHFMVVQDKNNDGNFNDNIPDGITDPYGWQSTSPDPWENYSFSYNGQRTGNKSYYLWDKQLSNLDSTLTSNGGIFNTERYKLQFPQNFTEQNLNLKIEAQPQTKTNDNKVSIGSTIKATLSDFVGNFKEQFSTVYQMTINYNLEDLVTSDPATLSIYSSNDGGSWTKEPSTIDQNNKTVTAELNHMTYFALMADRKDTQPPVTEAIIEGEKGTENWYRSNLNIKLDAIDNQGGLGVEYTFYRIGNNEWKLYGTPLPFTEEGNYQIEFYSIDKDENSELPRILKFSIDKTIPEAKIMVNQSTKDLEISGLDTNTIQISNMVTNGIRTYSVTDLAGNTLKLNVQELDLTKRDQFSIKKLLYNDNVITPQYNLFRYRFLTRQNSSPLLENQFFTMNNFKENIDILYIPSTNKSKIITLKNGRITTKTETGLKLLQVTTNKGTLNYSY